MKRLDIARRMEKRAFECPTPYVASWCESGTPGAPSIDASRFRPSHRQDVRWPPPRQNCFRTRTHFRAAVLEQVGYRRQRRRAMTRRIDHPRTDETARVF